MNLNELTKTFALANDFKEGDLTVGGTRDDHLRSEARTELGSTRLDEIANAGFVEDQITETLHRSLDSKLADELAHLTVYDLKQILLSPKAPAWASHHANGLASEVIAAVAKVMTNDELGRVSRALFNPLPGEGISVGAQAHFGSRINQTAPATILKRYFSRFWKG